MEGETEALAGRTRVRIPDRAYWLEQIRCQAACPVYTDARGYVRAIAEGDDARAHRIARGPNPLASTCGRVCGAPCEAACRRGESDGPVAIRALKRFITERVGSGAGTSTGGDGAHGPASPVARVEELGHLLRARVEGRLPAARGQRVAVVGSGPAGLACAHDLACMGFHPVVFEREAVPGGMLALGVPTYRLPREVIRAEIGRIEALGVTFRCGARVGVDVSWETLRRDFAAVVIAVGVRRCRWLDLPGGDAAGIVGGVDFLRAVALRQPVDLGGRVVVIGGGNVAFDVGRTVLRQHMVDAARTALRGGAGEVALYCLESIEEMPADDVEILEAAEEGIGIHPGWGPLAFRKGEDGRLAGVTFQRCVSVYDARGRFAPVFDGERRCDIDAETALLAVGQAPDLDFLDGGDVPRDARGRPVADPGTLATTTPGVFLAGDLAHGPKLLIHAVASGKRAARAVYRFLTGREVSWEEPVSFQGLPGWSRERGFETLARTRIQAEPAEVRTASQACVVERVLSEGDARREASRCLDCGVQTIFDSDRCVLCGGCADVCPEACLRLVRCADLDGGADLDRLMARRNPFAGPGEVSAIIKDETRCTRCALCAARCPVGAISMERVVLGRATE